MMMMVVVVVVMVRRTVWAYIRRKIKPLDHARHMGHAWVRMKKIKTCHSSLSHLGYAENLFQMRPQLIELLSNDAICMCIAVQARLIVKYSNSPEVYTSWAYSSGIALKMQKCFGVYIWDCGPLLHNLGFWAHTEFGTEHLQFVYSESALYCFFSDCVVLR